MFEGRRLLIVTQHQKEKVIAPILEKSLGLKCIVSTNINTDTFGTFSGEINRKDEAIVTLRNKCLTGINNSEFDLAVASEGSFGPHPSLFFVPANEEYMILIDQKNDLEIVVKDLSLETNYNGQYINNLNDLYEFAEASKFPNHALILKNSKDDFSDISKGILDYDYLKEKFESLILKYGQAFVETDMRAMYNPSRMLIIEKVTKKLVDALLSLCPTCKSPGFVVTEIKTGLPCRICNEPTSSIISKILECKKCNYKKEELYPDQKFYEKPDFCNFCNP
jgi:hypothetical protein